MNLKSQTIHVANAPYGMRSQHLNHSRRAPASRIDQEAEKSVPSMAYDVLRSSKPKKKSVTASTMAAMALWITTSAAHRARLAAHVPTTWFAQRSWKQDKHATSVSISTKPRDQTPAPPAQDRPPPTPSRPQASCLGPVSTHTKPKQLAKHSNCVSSSVAKKAARVVAASSPRSTIASRPLGDSSAPLKRKKERARRVSILTETATKPPFVPTGVAQARFSPQAPSKRVVQEPKETTSRAPTQTAAPPTHHWISLVTYLNGPHPPQRST